MLFILTLYVSRNLYPITLVDENQASGRKSCSLIQIKLGTLEEDNIIRKKEATPNSWEDGQQKGQICQIYFVCGVPFEIEGQPPTISVSLFGSLPLINK